MSFITVDNLHEGVNLQDDPASPMMSGGETQDCVGIDLTKTGKLQTILGDDAHDLTTSVPSGVIQCIQIFYMSGVRYVLCTKTTGLYANGVLMDASFTGKFKGVVVGNMIYLVNGNKARRFDGAASYQLGIEAPGEAPTFTASAQSTKELDTFESLATWIANASSCTVTAEGTIFSQGTQSMQVDVTTAGTSGSTYQPWAAAKDLEVFDDASASTVKDLVKLSFYVTSTKNLSSIRILFDVGDGTFKQNFYYYNIPLSGEEVTKLVTSAGGYIQSSAITTSQPVPSVSGWFRTGHGDQDDGSQTESVTVPSEVSPTGVSTVVKTSSDGRYSFWQSLSGLSDQAVETYLMDTSGYLLPNTWFEMGVPKSTFGKVGSSGDWSSVTGVKIEVITGGGATTVYFDDLKMVGGGGLRGLYWLMYGWARTDASGNVIHYSGPARDGNGNLVIQGPIEFQRQQVAYGARVASTDSQVNACVVYVLGGVLADWWVGAVITNNGVAAGTVNIDESTLSKRMVSLRSSPAPAGNDIAFSGDRLWMVGFAGADVGMLRFSDISVDGDVMFESWPYRNGYVVSGAGKPLLSIDDFNRQLIIRGEEGEWSCALSNPLDYTSLSIHKTSSKPCIGTNSVFKTLESLIYPALGGFIETNGSTARPVFPKIKSMATKARMLNAQTIFDTFEGFYSYEDDVRGTDATIKVDFLTGKPRISYLNTYYYDAFALDEAENMMYGLRGGTVYRMQFGYPGVTDPWLFRVKSRGFRHDKGRATWKRITFDSQTGTAWFIVRAIVDGAEVAYQPFNTPTRSETRFDFGPTAGETFQFVIEGHYTAEATVYLPIRIYVDAAS